MSSEIARIVERTYREEIGLPGAWSPEQAREFLQRETTRLALLVAESAAEMGAAAIAAWEQRAGHAPDYLTTVGLVNNATNQAREVVLEQELYAQIPPEPEPEPELELEPEPTGGSVDPTEQIDRADPDRWRTPHRSEPTEAVVALVARLWPHRSDLFRIKAEYLLQARSEDGRPLPSSPESVLTQQLARLVEADLVSDGLPLG